MQFLLNRKDEFSAAGLQKYKLAMIQKIFRLLNQSKIGRFRTPGKYLLRFTGDFESLYPVTNVTDFSSPASPGTSHHFWGCDAHKRHKLG
jgi:hypothetical protein